ncbi:MAG: hypothetical protein GC155_07790 [Alphaproteobacteria bacterium]|nr:hypothetical protein [Alphaproteobacteria bacterium]
MPRVIMRPDNLNERNAEFEQTPLKQPVFLNSVPKCGTHLIRNIMRMFVPVEQQYHEIFIQRPFLARHGPVAFSTEKPMLSWGHLLFYDDSSIAVRNVRQIVLVRDPYDWVLARARFFLSENFDGSVGHLKNGGIETEDLLNLMILGIHNKAPNLEETFRHNACAWMGTAAHLIRYEDIITNLKRLETPEAEAWFMSLFAACGIYPPPSDWRERVRIGADRKQSSTARENLDGAHPNLPDALPETQKRLVDYAAPGLRRLLGYTV